MVKTLSTMPTNLKSLIRPTILATKVAGNSNKPGLEFLGGPITSKCASNFKIYRNTMMSITLIISACCHLLQTEMTYF